MYSNFINGNRLYLTVSAHSQVDTVLRYFKVKMYTYNKLTWMEYHLGLYQLRIFCTVSSFAEHILHDKNICKQVSRSLGLQIWQGPLGVFPLEPMSQPIPLWALVGKELVLTF